MIDMLHSSDTLASQMPVASWLSRVTIAIVIAAIASWCLRHRSAAMRHRVWLLGLMATVVIPLGTCFLPNIRLPMFADTNSQLQDQPVVGVVPQFEPSVDETISGLQIDRVPSNGSEVAGPPENRWMTDSTEWIGGGWNWQTWLAVIWGLGTISGVVVFLMSLIVQTKSLRQLKRIDDRQWDSAMQTAARRIGLPAAIQAFETSGTCVPHVIGVWSPRLLVPSDWKTWSPEQRDCILLHELAHVKRRDIAAQWIARTAVLAHWLNPLVWWAAKQLRREREIASDDCVLLAGQAASEYAQQLVRTLQSYRVQRLITGSVAMADRSRLDQRVLGILDPKRLRDPVGFRWNLCAVVLLALGSVVLGGLSLSADAQPPIDRSDDSVAATNKPVWKLNYTIEYPGTIPVSVVFSDDRTRLLTGDTGGELMALNLRSDQATYSWKTKVGGNHAATAYSLDGQAAYGTSQDGVVILDAGSGKEMGRIVEPESQPIAIGAFPDRPIDANHSFSQIVFGNPHGYFVKTWVAGRPLETAGTISTTTVPQEEQPGQPLAVPLAVDPQGRSAIMTGPVDATGQVSGQAGKNVLWAYVCGNYDEGSPGNRVMVGHQATVVCAAWSKESERAVTGDVDGRVIVWDTSTMKEVDRLELGGRVAALAMTDQGDRIAVGVIGGGAQVLVWELDSEQNRPMVVYEDPADYQGTDGFASLSFAADGKRLAGCLGNKLWLSRLGELVGHVRVWDYAPPPARQPAPRQIYNRHFSDRSGIELFVPNNNVIITTASQLGAFNLFDVDDGSILSRLRLGDVTLGKLALSHDQKWMAREEFAEGKGEGTECSVVVSRELGHSTRATVPNCQRLLDLSFRGERLAVQRQEKIEIWDTSQSTLQVTAPFAHERIDAAKFSPDGSVLVISDNETLIVWRLNDETFSRIPLGRRIVSLAFSPDGRRLAEGADRATEISIRDVKSEQVVTTISNGVPRLMQYPSLRFTQAGRVLIAAATFHDDSDRSISRLLMWDTMDGLLAHSVELGVGNVQTIEISPNELYVVANVEHAKGTSMIGLRLDGKDAPVQSTEQLPAATRQP